MYITEHPIYGQWHPVKNSTLDPSVLKPLSNLKVWWLCDKGHEWEGAIQDRTRGSGLCPFCSGKRVLSGFNDVVTLFPEVAVEWHPVKNESLSPQDVVAGSGKKVWWLGSCSHEWEATVSSRTYSGQGCPVCAGKVILLGFNDLDTTAPVAATLWNNDKNILPSTSVTRQSGKKAWWKCEENHEWEAKVSDVVQSTLSGLTGCPFCAGRRTAAGKNDLLSQFPEVAKLWHPTKNGEVTPADIQARSNKEFWWLCDKNHEWLSRVAYRTDKRNYGCPVCSGRNVHKGVNDLETLNQEIASEWNQERNELAAGDVSMGSHFRAWWICSEGHEWEAVVKDRVGHDNRKGTGCPFCSNRNIVTGFNDLASLRPDVAKDWDYTKNAEVNADPTTVGVGSGLIVWWVCSKNHMKQQRVVERSLSGCGSCNLTNVSSYEETLHAHLRQILGDGVEIRRNDRSVLSGKELDFYIPSKNVAIEFNGVYWHSDRARVSVKGKTSPKWRHHEKWLACQEKGIQLIQVWEDDWNSKQAIILKSLSRKLSVGKDVTVFGRNTQFKTVSAGEVKQFFEENHIQGFVGGSIYAVLTRKASDEIVAAMILTKLAASHSLRLDRYATSCNVPGGFSKLLKHVVEGNPSFKEVVTFSDHCVSDGGLYENNGFVADKELPPDYMYVVKGERQHKFGYRLRRFKSDPELLWDEGLTESELAELNGLPRIWDAGKTRWVKTF